MKATVNSNHKLNERMKNDYSKMSNHETLLFKGCASSVSSVRGVRQTSLRNLIKERKVCRDVYSTDKYVAIHNYSSSYYFNYIVSYI